MDARVNVYRKREERERGKGGRGGGRKEEEEEERACVDLVQRVEKSRVNACRPSAEEVGESLALTLIP
jgi:hypothetical protein